MKIEIGKNQKQKEGFSSFVPGQFPPKGIFDLSQQILIKAANADRLIGKLDGITDTLPDVDFFLSMFVIKDATSSSQIEGTRATMIDAIEMEAGLESKKTTDADDILFYIKSLNYGVKRLESFPMSLRFIRDLHSKLMTGARSTQFANPGEFRKTQNWIGGTRPDNARFIPPQIDVMNRSLNDLEGFLRTTDQTLPLIQIAIVHAQFETIHPFLDGNGRTGRLLITMFLFWRGFLERPVLFLSSYFKKHQKTYYLRLNEYHDGEVEKWVDFFLDGIIETAKEAVIASKKIIKLREEDMGNIIALSKRESESGVLVMQKLYAQPIITTRSIMEWTNFSRPGAQKLVDRFIEIGILQVQNEAKTYDKSYVYKKYLEIFQS